MDPRQPKEASYRLSEERAAREAGQKDAAPPGSKEKPDGGDGPRRRRNRHHTSRRKKRARDAGARTAGGQAQAREGAGAGSVLRRPGGEVERPAGADAVPENLAGGSSDAGVRPPGHRPQLRGVVVTVVALLLLALIAWVVVF